MHRRTYRVYILASGSWRIYVGITRDLPRRLWEHRHGPAGGFTRRHGISRLVHVEVFGDALAAITREKQLKRWPRWRQDRLIEMSNPTWAGLADA